MWSLPMYTLINMITNRTRQMVALFCNKAEYKIKLHKKYH